MRNLHITWNQIYGSPWHSIYNKLNACLTVCLHSTNIVWLFVLSLTLPKGFRLWPEFLPIWKLSMHSDGFEVLTFRLYRKAKSTLDKNSCLGKDGKMLSTQARFYSTWSSFWSHWIWKPVKCKVALCWKPEVVYTVENNTGRLLLQEVLDI